jgi:hypothetical protein
MSDRKNAFLESAQSRLAGLSGEAFTAELARIHEEMGAAVRAEADAQAQAQVESLRKDYIRARRTVEAYSLAAPIARPGLASLLAEQIAKRLELQQRDDSTWELVIRDATGRQTISPADLHDELRHTKELSALVQGSTPAEQAAHARRVAETLGLNSAATH